MTVICRNRDICRINYCYHVEPHDKLWSCDIKINPGARCDCVPLGLRHHVQSAITKTIQKGS